MMEETRIDDIEEVSSMAAGPLRHHIEEDDGPLEEKIRRRAYQLFIQRGTKPGSEVEDWLRAEEEILATQGRRSDDQLPEGGGAWREGVLPRPTKFRTER